MGVVGQAAVAVAAAEGIHSTESPPAADEILVAEGVIADEEVGASVAEVIDEATELEVAAVVADIDPCPVAEMTQVQRGQTDQEIGIAADEIGKTQAAVDMVAVVEDVLWKVLYHDHSCKLERMKVVVSSTDHSRAARNTPEWMWGGHSGR